jgi:hypothetical protein
MAAALYNMLTGQYPFGRMDGAMGDFVEQILAGRVVPIQERDRSIPDALARVIERGLVRDVAGRWQTARDFGSALREACTPAKPG